MRFEEFYEIRDHDEVVRIRTGEPDRFCEYDAAGRPTTVQASAAPRPSSTTT